MLFFSKIMLFLTMLGVFFIGQNIFYEQTVFYYWGNYIVILIYAAILYFICKVYNCFLFGRAGLHEIILSWALCLCITNALKYLQLSLQSLRLLPVMGFIVIFTAQIILAAFLAYCTNRLYFFLNPAHKAIIIYGREKKAKIYCDIFQKHKKHFKISRLISQDEPLEALQHFIDGSESVFFLDVDEAIREYLIYHCFKANKRIYILPTFSGVLLNTAEVLLISNTPMFLPRNPLPDIGARVLKRGMDIVISFAMLIVFSWLMLVVWLAIRLCDGGPAIYKQTRVTMGGKHFTLYKFRSMCMDSENCTTPPLVTKNDSRITPVGRFIRKTRIDELPQLVNVLFGSMSLVGPRPERPEIAKKYEELYPNFSFRTKVKAGLTGYAQIYGKYSTSPEEKLILDIMYIERFSIWQDVMLLLQTVKVFFLPSSAE